MSESKEVVKVTPREVATPEINVEMLLAKAIDKNVPIETMERLMEMAQTLQKETARKAFFTALAKFQKTCPVIPKTVQVYSKDGSPRYKYAPVDVIKAVVGKRLAQCGFSYTMNDKQEKGSYTASMQLFHVAGHMEVSEFTIPIAQDGYMTDQQHVAAAQTFAGRRVFCSMLGISSGDEDLDGGPLPPNGGGQSTTRRKPEPTTESLGELGQVYDEAIKALDSSPADAKLKETWEKNLKMFFEKKNLIAIKKIRDSIVSIKGVTNGTS